MENNHLSISTPWYSILVNGFTYIIHSGEQCVKYKYSPFKPICIFFMRIFTISSLFFSNYLKSRTYNFLTFHSPPVFLSHTVSKFFEPVSGVALLTFSLSFPLPLLQFFPCLYTVCSLSHNPPSLKLLVFFLSLFLFPMVKCSEQP